MSNVVVYQNTNGLKIGIKILTIIIIFFLSIDLLMTFISFMASMESNSNNKLLQNIEYHSSTRYFVNLFHLVFIIMYFRWIHLSYKNLNNFSINGLEFNSKSAIVYYFIPVLNLFKPFNSMKELWLSSNIKNFDNLNDKNINWKEYDVPGILNFWWILFIFGYILNTVVFLYPTTNDNIKIWAIFVLLGCITSIFSMIYTNKIVRIITMLQNEMMESYKN